MNTDLKNVIVKNVFKKEEIEQLYNEIWKIKNNFHIQEDIGRLYGVLYWKDKLNSINGHVSLQINEDLKNKICNIAQSYSDVLLRLESISFGRYSLEYGKPKLKPHVDDNFKQARLTFDVQLDSNVSWPLLVEYNKYILNNNEALIFSGTHQIHWREKKVFKEGEYLDMLLCQFSEEIENQKLIDKNFIELRTARSKSLKLKYEKGII